ncbi:MAG: hypothetical protein EOL87_04470 [Spartobacteria bacterium]|nr:hypothetical protein [Spartobacteria bacterium]
MKVLAFIFILFGAVLIQTVIPTVAWMGYNSIPVIIGSLLYYYFTGTLIQIVISAFAVGIMQDCVSGIPMGVSSLFYVLAGLLMYNMPSQIFEKDWISQALAGSLINSAYVFVVYLVLIQGTYRVWSIPFFVIRISGAMVLGACTVPVVCTLIDGFYQYLGVVTTRHRGPL